jgi:hypothetical protein
MVLFFGSDAHEMSSRPRMISENFVIIILLLRLYDKGLVEIRKIN